MKTALFTNFTDQEFIGYWNGKPRKYPAGSSEYMPDYLARHFAKHLTNKELLRTDSTGSLVYKDGDKMTSPKKPEEVPLFTELFNKAYTPDELDELGDERDDLDALIGSAKKNRELKMRKAEGLPTQPQSTPTVVIPDVQENPRANIAPQSEEDVQGNSQKQDPTQPQIILSPDFDEDGDDDNTS